MTDLSTIEQMIVNVADQVAAQYGVDPQKLAEISLGTASVESGFNPSAVNASYPPSYGLFQLDVAGEGAGLTQSEMDDPMVSAQTAIPIIAQALKANPGGDPGAIAAAAQRPANPALYATDVDAALQSLNASQLALQYQGTGTGQKQAATGTTTLGNVGPVPITVSTSGLLAGLGGVGAVLAGLAVIVVGVVLIAKPKLPKQVPVPVPI